MENGAAHDDSDVEMEEGSGAASAAASAAAPAARGNKRAAPTPPTVEDARTHARMTKHARKSLRRHMPFPAAGERFLRLPEAMHDRITAMVGRPGLREICNQFWRAAVPYNLLGLLKRDGGFALTAPSNCSKEEREAWSGMRYEIDAGDSVVTVELKRAFNAGKLPTDPVDFPDAATLLYALVYTSVKHNSRDSLEVLLKHSEAWDRLFQEQLPYYVMFLSRRPPGEGFEGSLHQTLLRNALLTPNQHGAKVFRHAGRLRLPLARSYLPHLAVHHPQLAVELLPALCDYLEEQYEGGAPETATSLPAEQRYPPPAFAWLGVQVPFLPCFTRPGDLSTVHVSLFVPNFTSTYHLDTSTVPLQASHIAVFAQWLRAVVWTDICRIQSMFGVRQDLAGRRRVQFDFTRGAILSVKTMTARLQMHGLAVLPREHLRTLFDAVKTAQDLARTKLFLLGAPHVEWQQIFLRRLATDWCTGRDTCGLDAVQRGRCSRDAALFQTAFPGLLWLLDLLRDGTEARVGAVCVDTDLLLHAPMLMATSTIAVAQRAVLHATRQQTVDNYESALIGSLPGLQWIGAFLAALAALPPTQRGGRQCRLLDSVSLMPRSFGTAFGGCGAAAALHALCCRRHSEEDVPATLWSQYASSLHALVPIDSDITALLAKARLHSTPPGLRNQLFAASCCRLLLQPDRSEEAIHRWRTVILEDPTLPWPRREFLHQMYLLGVLDADTTATPSALSRETLAVLQQQYGELVKLPDADLHIPEVALAILEGLPAFPEAAAQLRLLGGDPTTSLGLTGILEHLLDKRYVSVQHWLPLLELCGVEDEAWMKELLLEQGLLTKHGVTVRKSLRAADRAHLRERADELALPAEALLRRLAEEPACLSVPLSLEASRAPAQGEDGDRTAAGQPAAQPVTAAVLQALCAQPNPPVELWTQLCLERPWKVALLETDSARDSLLAFLQYATQHDTIDTVSLAYCTRHSVRKVLEPLMRANLGHAAVQAMLVILAAIGPRQFDLTASEWARVVTGLLRGYVEETAVDGLCLGWHMSARRATADPVRYWAPLLDEASETPVRLAGLWAFYVRAVSHGLFRGVGLRDVLALLLQLCRKDRIEAIEPLVRGAPRDVPGLTIGIPRLTASDMLWVHTQCDSDTFLTSYYLFANLLLPIAPEAILVHMLYVMQTHKTALWHQTNPRLAEYETWLARVWPRSTREDYEPDVQWLALQGAPKHFPAVYHKPAPLPPDGALAQLCRAIRRKTLWHSFWQT